MRHAAFLLVPMLALAGCGHKARQETQTTVVKDGVSTTTITRRDVSDDDKTISGLNIDSDKFKANIEIPGLSFTGDHMDMDGMKLYPGSTVKGVRVHAVDRPGAKKGEVEMNFVSPATPATVAQHTADEARKAGFTLTSNTTSLVSGSKVEHDKTNRFSVALNASGSGTAGVMTVSGSGDD